MAFGKPQTGKPAYAEGFVSEEDTPSKIIVPGSEWRDRVIVELEELTEKIVKLRRFMTSEKYCSLSESQAEMLRIQAKRMSLYADILVERLRCSG